MISRASTLTGLVVALVAFASCSSAGVPGAETTLDQVDKASKASLDIALQDAARAEETYLSIHGGYTTDLNALANEGDYRPQAEVTLTIVSADTDSFCIEATHGDLDGTWNISNLIPTVTEGACE